MGTVPPSLGAWACARCERRHQGHPLASDKQCSLRYPDPIHHGSMQVRERRHQGHTLVRGVRSGHWSCHRLTYFTWLVHAATMHRCTETLPNTTHNPTLTGHLRASDKDCYPGPVHHSCFPHDPHSMATPAHLARASLNPMPRKPPPYCNTLTRPGRYPPTTAASIINWSPKPSPAAHLPTPRVSHTGIQALP